jgi:hypothetical protein
MAFSYTSLIHSTVFVFALRFFLILALATPPVITCETMDTILYIFDTVTPEQLDTCLNAKPPSLPASRPSSSASRKMSAATEISDDDSEDLSSCRNNKPLQTLASNANLSAFRPPSSTGTTNGTDTPVSDISFTDPSHTTVTEYVQMDGSAANPLIFSQSTALSHSGTSLSTSTSGTSSPMPGKLPKLVLPGYPEELDEDDFGLPYMGFVDDALKKIAAQNLSDEER